MDLKKFLPGKDQSEKEYFWSLVIEPGWVQSGIWRIEEDKAQVVLSSPAFTWETDEDLVQAADNALSSSVQGLPQDIAEPSKTVFGVASSWVEEGQISGEYLEKIKHLCTELSLNPIGFVVLPESIAHLIKSEEGSPLNAIVLGVYKENLEITIFKLGNLLGTAQIARSVSIVDDVTEGLTRFSQTDNLPSRFIIYNGREGELEEVRQELLKVDWNEFKDLKFLHTPKIEIINTKQKVYAVSLAGASELANITSIEIVKESVEEKEGEPDIVASQGINESSFEQKPLEELGFAIEKDVSENLQNLEKEGVEIKEPVSVNNMDRDDIDEIHRNIEEVSLRQPKEPFSFKKVFQFVNSLKSKLTSFKRPASPTANFGVPRKKVWTGFGSGGKKPFVFGLGFLVILLISGFAFWWFYPKATVTIYLAPKRLDETFDIDVDTKVDSTDISKRILKGEVLRKDLSGEKTKDATGTKTVGENAKGEVTLYRVGTQLSLASGTIIHGPENLNFTLNGDVVVASGSASSPGMVKASVTAQEFGSQYNLASGTTFSVGTYTLTDIEAKNENAFSGGSSREITAVSVEDQKVLEEDLTEELTAKVKEQFLENVSSDNFFISESVTATPSSRVFSKKVGDEADTLKFSLTLEAESVVLAKSDLEDVAKEVLKEKVPEGFTLRGEQVDYTFELESKGKDVYSFEVRVSANLLPEINTEEIAQKIRGRSLTVAEEYLRQEAPGFIRAEMRIKPTLPGKLKTLPHIKKNIEIEVAAER
ncbi:hypothetical protein A2714_01495 [Candidatus Woesebacteria bacterium RIFCSPHIGHO2_01_FULL_38_9]|uniref:Baseplate protein J-like domain-containing protein n=2 Tax=Candidatus Woeseibacteriota TaxID=1752722 RepID=A0A1F7XYF4_9BACT|nr:MAG: hypothetical protein A2714_01495 [Candidatus Woesebacteria bacterium RIFCSPHIGHO2_01_FULL_38_9]OGM58604.1 MAG: hypothetical protein A3A75_01060 [Candidatus Woesebacteria bacterium RIFCSPLOWO2_01_FULL_39_10]